MHGMVLGTLLGASFMHLIASTDCDYWLARWPPWMSYSESTS